MSRSAKSATITIVDNISRAVPSITNMIGQYKKYDKAKLNKIIMGYNNKKELKEALKAINKNLGKISKTTHSGLLFPSKKGK